MLPAVSTPPFRRRSIVALLFAVLLLGTSAAGPAAAASSKLPAFAVEQDFAKQAATVEALLAAMSAKLGAGESVEELGTELRAAAQRLRDLDAQMRARFAEREAGLIDAGLPAIILERHHATVRIHEADFEILDAGLAEVDRAARGRGAFDLENAVRDARRHLGRHPMRDPERFLSRDSLPFAAANRDAPVRDISEAKARTAIGTLEPPGDGGAVARGGAPVADDLAATADVDLSDEAVALAGQLGNDARAIYLHVRDNFRFEPYPGSRKGSRETLLVAGGNDYDLASALIALLRAADIPARYVRAPVLMTAEQVKGWLGVTDAATAANILATAGMNPTAFATGQQITHIGFDHVWVSAYVPYGNYRGVANDDSAKAWVDLDPSFKLSDFPPSVDIPEEMGFDAQAFIDDYISTFHEPSPVELYLQQIEAYVAAEHPELEFPEDVFHAGVIRADTIGLLAGSLPFTQLEPATESAAIAASDRHRIRFHIHDGGVTLLDHTVDLPAIASRRTTISYVPATPADQAAVDFYGQLYLTPPDLIDLKPVLRIEGVAVATGNAVGAGELHNSDIHFLTPAEENNVVPVVQNVITAGTYQGIGIDTFSVAPEALQNGPDEALPDADALTGEKLYRTAMTYLDRVDRSGLTVAQTQKMVLTTAVSDAIVENVVAVSYTFQGTPVAWEWKGLVVDADRKILGPHAIDGDESKEKPFFVLAGADASILENRVFEDLYGEEAVSTIKILELASDMGVTICRIITSIATDCPTMSQPPAVVNAVTAALAQGHEVTIPRAPITYFDWSGTGYIDMDPDTGAAGYIISGGQSGGATVDEWTTPWMLIFAVLGQDVCNITAQILSPNPNDCFPYPGFFAGLFNTQPSEFVVTYTVYYCEDDPVDVTESYSPHFQYPPGNYVFHAGWGTGATLPFTIFNVDILSTSDEFMGKGYTGPPVAGDPEPAKIRYLVEPDGFTPDEAKLFVKRGSDLRTMTLPNASGMQEATFNGKKDDNSFLDAGAHTVRVRIKCDGKEDESDEGPLEVVEVTKVELFDEDGAALEANAHPDKPGGKRIFTGRSSAAAGSRRNKAKVRATLSASVPAGKLKVNLKSFDVDDPTGLINANHGTAMGTPAEGTLSDNDPPTDGDDTVEVDLTVTMQPGDNFKAFASTNANLISNLTDAIVEANTDAMGATSDMRLMPLASDRLTVWRKVHVEMDNMGDITGNSVSGMITSVIDAGATSTVVTDQNFSEIVSGTNRFAQGILTSGGKTFRVQSNNEGANFRLRVENIGPGPVYQLPVVGAFTVVDDDDMDGNDATLNGDAGENVRNPDRTRFSSTDDTASNAFAPAYVKPVYDVGDSNSAVALALNTPDGADEKSLLLATYDFDQVATEADNDFWTVYLLGAYQMQSEEDDDPESEGGTLGQVDEIHGQGASVFIETARDVSSVGGGCIEPITTSHEIGHLFSLVHGDGGQMTSPCNGGTANFTNASLMRIRNLDHP